MTGFGFTDPYQDQDDSIGYEDQTDDEFDVGINISNLDVQKLFNEVKQLDIADVQRELADATIALQAGYWKRWSKYAGSVGVDPETLIRKRNPKVFIFFLEWNRMMYPRANRLTSYESLWKNIRELYYDRCKVVMPAIVAGPVTKYLQTDFCQKHSLARGMLQTYTVGHNTLLGMLHYHWTFDTSSFSIERERVQLAAILLFLAYTGARPGAIVESSSEGLRGSGQAMLYRDLKLKLLRPPDGCSLLVLEVTIRLDKGKRKRPSPKTITLYENRQCPAMCPVVHFLALAFADNAFHPKLQEFGLSPDKLHSFNHMEGRTTLEFKFRDEVLGVPVFRSWQTGLQGITVHPTKPLSARVLNQESQRLGQLAGLPHPFRAYCLRREVGTQLTNRGVSDQQRNQILGHARSETFLKHYLSSSVITDVQATFLGQESKSDLIREMGKLTLRRDPNLPKELTLAQKREAHNNEELNKAQAKFEDLGKELRTKYGQISKAPADCEGVLARNALRTHITSLKSRCERQAFRKILENFHSDADLEQMILQLKGEKPRTLSMLSPVRHAFPERNALVETLFLPADPDVWPTVVNAMVRLCSLRETRYMTEETTCSSQKPCEPPLEIASLVNSDSSGEEPGTTVSHSADLLAMAIEPASIAANSVIHESLTKSFLAKPIAETSIVSTTKRSKQKGLISARSAQGSATLAGEKLHLPRNVCLFCYDPRREKNHSFPRRDHLRRHYRTTHFQYQVGPFFCPVPTCKTLIHDPDQFCAHATSIHKSDLGVRASIMRSKPQQTRPGQLQNFRL